MKIGKRKLTKLLLQFILKLPTDADAYFGSKKREESEMDSRRMLDEFLN